MRAGRTAFDIRGAEIAAVIVAVALCSMFMGCIEGQGAGDDKLPLAVEVVHAFSYDKNHLNPDNDTTMLRLDLRSAGEYDDLHVNVLVPTASRVSITPSDRYVGTIGKDEVRSHDFVISTLGQDNGTYNVMIEVYDAQGLNSSVTYKTQLYVGDTAGDISVAMPGFTFLSWVLGLLFMYVLVRRR